MTHAFHRPHRFRSRRMLLRLAVLGSMAAAIVTLGAAPASAHAALDSINPADGAVLTEPPTQVELRFNERLLEASVRVAVTNSAGEVVIRDRSTVSGPVVSVPWDPALPADTYAIGYRVVSGDGHPITGQSSFELNIPPASPSPAEETPIPITPAPSASTATRAPSSTAVPTPSSSPMPVTADSGNDSSGFAWWPLIAALVLGTAGGVGIVIWQRRRRT